MTNEEIKNLNNAITAQEKLVEDAKKRKDVKAEVWHQDIITKLKQRLDEAHGKDF